MVTHETYKDIDGNWIFPEEVIFEGDKAHTYQIQKKLLQ